MKRGGERTQTNIDGGRCAITNLGVGVDGVGGLGLPLLTRTQPFPPLQPYMTPAVFSTLLANWSCNNAPPVSTTPPPPPPTGATPVPAVGWSGSRLMIIYHIGVYAALYNTSAFVPGTTPTAGSSGGSYIALGSTTGATPEVMKANFKALVENMAGNISACAAENGGSIATWCGPALLTAHNSEILS